MVRSGAWALAFVLYSREYVADELEAKTNHAGLWSGAFIAPWDWRGSNKQTEVLGAASVPVNAQAILLSAVSAGEAPDQHAPSRATSTAPANASIMSRRRWYAKVNMDLIKESAGSVP